MHPHFLLWVGGVTGVLAAAPTSQPTYTPKPRAPETNPLSIAWIFVLWATVYVITIGMTAKYLWGTPLSMMLKREWSRSARRQHKSVDDAL